MQGLQNQPNSSSSNNALNISTSNQNQVSRDTRNPTNPTNTRSKPKTRPPQRYIHCKVCHAFINVTNKMHQPVVRCTTCKEATPIRGPQPGKQFVRCPCNCLLICKANSSRILCPRKDCGRTIAITKTPQVSHNVNHVNHVPQRKIDRNQNNNQNNNPNTYNSQTKITSSSSAQQLSTNNPHLQHLSLPTSSSQNQALNQPHIHSPFSDRRRRAFGGSNTSIANNSVYSAGSFNNTFNNTGPSINENSESNSFLSHHHGVIDAGSSDQLITTEGPNGSQSVQRIRTTVSKAAPKLVRLQCAYCHMEFVRLTPLRFFFGKFKEKIFQKFFLNNFFSINFQK